jgi:beta-N-acetylhexosaminidase
VRRIKGEKASIINYIFGNLIFLIIGIVRPTLVYFLNLDIIEPILIIMLVLSILIVIFVKENKREKVDSFDRAVNIFIVGSVLIIINNKSIIFTPLLSIIGCILIYILYRKGFKPINIKNYVSYLIIVVSIGLIVTSFIQDFLSFSNLYHPDKGYKSCGIIKNLEVPINAKERNYKLNIDNLEDTVGYRIQDINIKYEGTPVYIQKLESDGWEVIDTEYVKGKGIYTLSKDESRVIIEMKENSLIIGALADVKKDSGIKEKISKMTLEEKIGQMIIAGFNGTTLNEELITLMNELDIGGVILFSRNIKTSSQLKDLTKDINGLSENIPLFISIDEEGGRVSRLPNDTNKFESARKIGDKKNANYAYKNGKKLGSTLKEHNINMNFAPVIDIYSNPKNTVIGDRAFGTDEKIVSTMGIATMKGLKEEGVIPVVKHFPGHGDTELDSHFKLPSVSKTLDELENFELVPFKEAIDKGCDVVMVSHILMEKIDSKNPATLSKKVIGDLLRDKMNFDGVVVTDDMHMKAISDNISIEKASVNSINAGSDIILIGSDVSTTKDVIDEIKLAVKNKNISEDRIDESVYRILKLKEKYLKIKK